MKQNETLNKKFILIVEDDIYSLELLKKTLEKESYLVKTSTNGNSALNIIKNENPDLVLLDIELNDINGIELCKIIKSDPNNNYLPIIVITENADMQSIIDSYKAGCVDYVIKPFEQKTLLAHIENQLKISKLHKELIKKLEETAAINKELSDANQKLQKFFHEAENHEEFLKTTINSIHQGIISTNHKGIINNINNFACSLLNINYKDAIEKPFYIIFKILNPDKKLTTIDFFELVAKTNEPIFFNDSTYITVGNNKYFVSGNISPIKTKSGKINGYIITFSDVTKKTLKTKQLNESRERFSLVIQSLQQGIWDWDSINNEVYYSPEWKAQIGYEDHELENKFEVWAEHLHPDEREQKVKELEKFLASTNKYFYLQFRFRHRDGTYRYIQNKAIAERNNDNKVIRMVGSHDDITSQKEAELKLKASQKKWETIFNELSHPTMILDANHNILEVNKSLCEKAGKSAEELKKLKCWHIFHSTNSEESPENCPLNKTLTLKETQNAEMEMLAFGGHYLVSCTPIQDKNKKVRAIVHIATDITSLKETMQKLKDSENKFRYAFDTSSDLIVISKLKGFEIAYANQEFFKITGLTKEQAIDKSTGELNLWVSDIERENLKNLILTQNKISDIEIKFFDKDRKIRIGLISASVFELNKEEHAILIVRDITDRKHQEELLEQALERAEESDKLKSAFLANISHEIRTPMNGILGFAELLKMPELSEKDRNQYISIIEKSGHQMLNLINDIIDLSKVDAGILKPKPKECNINQIFKDIFLFFKPEADIKNIKFDYFTELPYDKAKIISDPKLLTGILTNLLNNSLKYTNSGKINFYYNLKNKFLEFHVKDTSIGISKEMITTIFDRFTQADSENIIAKQGAGLGLAIAKAYVEILDGEISVNSTKNKGSDFYFTIPYKPVSKKNKITSLDSKEKNNDFTEKLKLNILIAEDDKISEFYLTTILKNFANKIFTSNNGVDAVEIVRNNPEIDLIMMDLRMPELNGYEATKKIREFNKNVKIIAQTAFAHDKDKIKSLEAGCNEYISKPINKSELFNIIEKLFSNKIN